MASLNCDIEGELLGRVDARLLDFLNVTIKLNQATLYLMPFNFHVSWTEGYRFFAQTPKLGSCLRSWLIGLRFCDAKIPAPEHAGSQCRNFEQVSDF